MTDEPTKLEQNDDLNSSKDIAVSKLKISVEVPTGVRLKISVEAQPVSDEEGIQPLSTERVYVSDLVPDEGGTYSIAIPVPLADETLQRARPSGVSWSSRMGKPISKGIEYIKQRLNAWPYSLATTLFGLSLVVYLLVRLVGLTSFPIYFFSDEAIQTNLAADLLRDNFKNYDGEFLPTYFYNVDKYSLGTSVYLQVLPYLIFGKSDYVTRATSVFVTLLAAVYIGLILRDIFKFDYWWVGTLLLSLTPAWFLHSRTAFETVIMVSFYSAGLYYYLLYRYRAPRYLYISLIFFSLAFYSYNPGQSVVVFSGLLLLISDFRYHWKNKAVVLGGLGLLVILILPYLRFRINHPDAIQDHLYKLGSYWIQPISLSEKLKIFWDEYVFGLSPGYWFIPNTKDLSRHLMKGYGHFQRASLPIAIFGLLVVIRNIRSSAYRAVLISFLAAPIGSALVHIAVTRALVIVIPITLMISIGLIKILKWLEECKWKLSQTFLSLIVFAALCFVNVNMMVKVLKDGPTWYPNYGLGGMQYGGRQVYSAVNEYLDTHPGALVSVSPSWANGADVIANFYLPDPIPIQHGNIDHYLYNQLELEEDRVFVMTAEEYEKVITSGKFTDIQVGQIIDYPNGEPGFYFVTLQYTQNVAEILEAEKAERSELHEEEIILDGDRIKVRFPLLDMGKIEDLWDGDPNSVVRTFEANPFIIEVTFPEPRSIKGISLVVGDTIIEAKVQLFPAEGVQPEELSVELTGSVQEPQVYFDFGELKRVKILKLEVSDLLQNEPAHVHLWEVQFK